MGTSIRDLREPRSEKMQKTTKFKQAKDKNLKAKDGGLEAKSLKIQFN